MGSRVSCKTMDTEMVSTSPRTMTSDLAKLVILQGENQHGVESGEHDAQRQGQPEQKLERQ